MIAKRYFSLVELLVVILIIALLAGLLLPVLSKARKRAWAVEFVNHLRQLGLGGFAMYANDYKCFPYGKPATIIATPGWHHALDFWHPDRHLN